MTEPENALTKQYPALVAAEGAELEFTADGDRARSPGSASMAQRPDGEHRRPAAAHGDDRRCWRTCCSSCPTAPRSRSSFDREIVRDRLKKIVEDEDLRRYIL